MSDPIRILHVFGRLDAGGAESRTMDIYRNIDRNKIQFDFVVHTEDKSFFTDEVIELGGKIHSFPRFNGKNIFAYRKQWETFFSQNPNYNIVHGHMTTTAFIYLKAAKKFNVPIRIAHSRNANRETIIKKILSRFSKESATHLFAVSKLAGISEFGLKAFENGQVRVIPNAIDAKKYEFNCEIRNIKRKEFNIGNENLFINVASFTKQKNHSFLLEIFNDILKEEPKSKLLLVGDGKLRLEIEKKIKELKIEKSVIIAGVRSDVPELLQSADALIFPSFYEGLPGVVLEAQAAGLPCVISKSITDEVGITNLVEFISLNKNTTYWSKEIFRKINETTRRSTLNDVRNAGYDITTVSEGYEKFYTSILQ